MRIHCPARRNPSVVEAMLAASERIALIGVLRTIFAAVATDYPTREKSLSVHPWVSFRLQDRAPRGAAPSCDYGFRDHEI